MTQRIEAVFDPGQLLAGKSTTIIRHRDTIAIELLVGILNSAITAFAFRRLFESLALSGGYLRVGPPQLRRAAASELDGGCWGCARFEYHRRIWMPRAAMAPVGGGSRPAHARRGAPGTAKRRARRKFRNRPVCRLPVRPQRRANGHDRRLARSRAASRAGRVARHFTPGGSALAYEGRLANEPALVAGRCPTPHAFVWSRLCDGLSAAWRFCARPIGRKRPSPMRSCRTSCMDTKMAWP